MDVNDTERLIYLSVLLCAIAGWFLMSSRETLNKTLQFGAVWAIIFIGGAAAVGLWQDISRQAGSNHHNVTRNGAIVVPRARDGHYYLSAQVNGATIRFVLDTGATDLVLTQADARRAGLDPGKLLYQGRANTANGQVRTAFVKLDRIQLGTSIDHDVAAVVNEGDMTQSLLGMGYLQRWGRIEIADGELILTR